jgi:hypothetical protein
MVAALVLAAAPAWSGPRVIDVATEVKTAWLIAEAHVLEVDAPSENRRESPDSLRVRVTNDPQRIFRGHTWLGAELELKIPPDGAIRLFGELTTWVGRKQHLLLVADAKRMVVLGGYPGPTGYRMHAWVDFHAGKWRIECTDPALGGPIAEGEHRGAVVVERSALALVHRDEGRAFWATVAPYLIADASDPESHGVDRLIALLSSGSPKERDYAQATLIEDARLEVLRIRQALETARDPEARRRLPVILDGIRHGSRPIAVALGIPEASRRHVVEEALPLLEGGLRARAERWLARAAPTPQEAPVSPR